MARIRRSNTKPELAVRKLLHKLGYRFRIQFPNAPGRPDVAFPGRRKIVFIHGCFWHQHPNCKLAHVPSTRRDFWSQKFDRNRIRDERDLARAAALGWTALVVWECETKDTASLAGLLEAFLGPTKLPPEK